MFKRILKYIYKRQKISSIGICSICNKEFQDKDLKIVEDLALCQKDFTTFKERSWVLYETVFSDPSNPEKALYINDLKEQLASQGIKSYIKSSYTHDSTNNIITKFDLYKIK